MNIQRYSVVYRSTLLSIEDPPYSGQATSHLLLSDLILVVADVANTASSHTHPYTDNGSPMNTQVPNQAGFFSTQKNDATTLRQRLDPVTEI